MLECQESLTGTAAVVKINLGTKPRAVLSRFNAVQLRDGSPARPTDCTHPVSEPLNYSY